MSKEDLRELLKLKPKAASSPITNSGRESLRKSAPESLFVLKLDEWDRAQGGKIIRHNSKVRDLDLTPEEISDFYALHYLTSPEVEETCSDKRRKEFLSAVLESPDHLALHRRTELNALASELATEEMGKAYSELKQKDQKREEGRKNGKEGWGEAAKKGQDLLRAVSVALSTSETAVDSMEDALSALGCGPGSTGGPIDTDKLTQLFLKVREDQLLRSIMDKAGKCRRFAQARQRQKVRHGYDDVVGVTLGGSVEKLLPIELLQLSDPEMELEATRRLVERQSLCKDYRGVERVGKGPIVMCVDESGSMDGDPIQWAKAIALTMAWVARAQNRFCVLVGYSGGTEGTKLVLSPRKWDEGALLEWLVHNFGNGTDMDIPLEQLPNQWWDEFVSQGMKRGKTDLILVTDAIVRIPELMERNFNNWKQRDKVRCITLVLDQHGYWTYGDSKGGDLNKVSDEVHMLKKLDLEQEAVQQCLSI